MDFEDWLLAEGLSISTAKKYVGALNGALTTWGKENKIITDSLSNLSDPSEFFAITEKIKATTIFSERNTRGNHMYGATLANYSRYLNDDSKIATKRRRYAGPFSKDLAAIEKEEHNRPAFNPDNESDGRKRVLKAVVRRQGQPKFRSNLIAAYQGRCAITNCKILEILDAAHVTPYLGPHTNSISNGILLRTDLHALWDQGLMAINPETMKVSINPTLDDEHYQLLNNLPIFQPIKLALRLSQKALAEQWEIYRQTLAT